MYLRLVFIFLIILYSQSIAAQNAEYAKSELALPEEDLEKISENQLRSNMNLNFVGDANIQNSINSGSQFSSNTGIGVILNRFLLKDAPFIRQYDLYLNINVASSADTLYSQFNAIDNSLNRRKFGTYLLIPENSGQSAELESSVYFNSFGDMRNMFTKICSGVLFNVLGSNSTWAQNRRNYNLAALSLKTIFFHEFLSDKVRFENGYSIKMGVGYSSRYILGDINFSENRETKKSFINTENSSFHGVEFLSRFQFRNVIAEVSIPLLGRGEIPGLTRSQFVTSIKFIGGFPLKLNNQQGNASNPKSLGI